MAAKIDDAYSGPNPQLNDLKLTWPAVISREMVRLVWPGQDPIGRTFILGGVVTVQVIGVAGDVKAQGIREAAGPQAYFPLPAAQG